jgi:hypothetical protein
MIIKSNNKEKSIYKTKRYPSLEKVNNGKQEAYVSDGKDSDFN